MLLSLQEHQSSVGDWSLWKLAAVQSELDFQKEPRPNTCTAHTPTNDQQELESYFLFYMVLSGFYCVGSGSMLVIQVLTWLRFVGLWVDQQQQFSNKCILAQGHPVSTEGCSKSSLLSSFDEYILFMRKVLYIFYKYLCIFIKLFIANIYYLDCYNCFKIFTVHLFY